MARGVKGSGLSPEERKERNRIRARDAYRKKKGRPVEAPVASTGKGKPAKAVIAPTGFAATIAKVDELVKRIAADAQELGRIVGS